MSTTAWCGSSGSVSLGGEISNWVVSIEQDTPDVSSMQSNGFKEYIACLKQATGSFDSYDSIGQIGTHAGVDFINGKETISMNIIITDVAITTPVDGAVTWKYTFVSNGEVTVA